MSEGREDANWDTAQATHREIQEEILHSRNLELFEDVERLLPSGKLPECVEEEMPVDPWDPEDQKLRKKLPAASTRSPKAKSKTKGKEKESKHRGHEIPEGAPDGFKSVAQLLRDADRSVDDGGKKSTAKGKNPKRARSPSPIRSENEEMEQMEQEDDEAEMELLYGGVPRAKKAKVDSGPSGSRRSGAKVNPGKTRTNRKTAIKAAIPVSNHEEGPTNPKPSEEAQRQAEREELNRSALDFFNTQGPRRQRPPTPERTPPSSPSILSSPPQAKARKLPILKATHPPLSPNTDESLGAADRPPEQSVDLTAENQAGVAQARLTPRTATAAGFSQIDPIDLLWEDDEFIPSPAPAPIPSRPSYPPGSALPAPVATNRSRTLGLSRPRPAPVTHTLSTEMMPPPPLPAHRLSSPVSHYSHGSTTPVMDATQFPVRRAGRRGRVLLSSSERPSGAMELDTESPLAQPVRLRRRREEDEAMVASSSSPPPVRAGRAGRRKRADPSRVKEFVSGAMTLGQPRDCLMSLWLSFSLCGLARSC
jgi:ATP-dependent DNA helicase MPH1